jgi:hypothetical protein
MASIAFDAQTLGGFGTTTFSHTTSGIDRALWVTVSRQGGTLSGVTFNGVAMTMLTEVLESGSGRHISLWYLAAPATGANNVVISISGHTFVQAIAVSYTGAKQTGIPDASASNTGTGTTQTGTVTTVAAGCWMVFVVILNGAAAAAGSGCVMRTAGTGLTSYYFDSNGSVGAPGSHAVSTTSSSVGYGYIVASFAPVPDDPSSGMFLVF